jgi:hypothetical protein
MILQISSYVVDDANWFPKYVRRGETENDPDIIIGSKYFTQRWKENWDYNRANKVNKAKDVAHAYVKGLITDAMKYPGKGFDRLAQTRIVSSYGFIQLLYTMAITDGKFYKETDNRYFPTGTQYMDKTNVSKYPEMLNEQDISMPRYSDRLLRNLNFLFPGRIPQSEWRGKRVEKNDEGEIINTYFFDGFEANWKGSLYFYNPSPGYPDEVWNKAQNYLPHE